MSKATTQPTGPWFKRGFLNATKPIERRKRRLRDECRLRLERLEDRTMLNASIDIDAAGLLTYNTDPVNIETLKVSVSGNVYTFTSDLNIDILGNSAGLPATGDGEHTVKVTGINTLTVNIRQHGACFIESTNVATHLTSFANNGAFYLGSYVAGDGLSKLTAPLSVVAGTGAVDTRLDLYDSSSSLGAHYTVTSQSIESTRGFGGVTFSGIDRLNLYGAAITYEENSSYDVLSTPEDAVTTIVSYAQGGSSHFNVETTATTGGDTSLYLTGELGWCTYDIRSASSPIFLGGGQESAIVNLTADSTTSGIRSLVNISSLGAYNVFVDNSAGADGTNSLLTGSSQTSEVATLSHFGGEGGFLTFSTTSVRTLTYWSARGRDNSLTLDFDHGIPLPVGGTSVFNYDGGGTPNSRSDLILVGSPPTGVFPSESHAVSGGGSGSIAFPNFNNNLNTTVNYSGLAPDGLTDLPPTHNYTFNYLGAPDIPIVVGAGDGAAAPGNIQTLQISSLGASPAFFATDIANKSTVRVKSDDDSKGYITTVNYKVSAAAAGITTLILAGGNGGDQARLIQSLPGVAVRVDQGDGDDLAYVNLPGSAAAASTALDGGGGNDSLTIDARGVGLTAGNFSVGADGWTIISGATVPGAGISYAGYESVTVIIDGLPSLSPSVTSAKINAVQGQRLVDTIVGTFNTAAPGARASDFVSTINWGDGSSSAGAIVQDASNPPVFYVMGTHTYYEAPAWLTTSITVFAPASATTQFINGVPVAFTPLPATASGTAVVASAAISLVVNSFSGFENVAPDQLKYVAATFTDPGMNPAFVNPTGLYAASINWGDGSGVFPIPFSEIARNGTSNSFTITLPQHVYATPGSYVVTVSVSDGPVVVGSTAVTATATGVAHIADAPLTASPVQPVIPAASEGVLFSDQVIGSFTDLNPIPDLASYTVTIDWGDGSPQSAGRVIQPGGPGTVLQILGTHTYADSLAPGATVLVPAIFPPFENTFTGTYPLRISVRDAYGSAANLANTITVNDRPITVSGRLDPASDSGVSNSDAITNVSQPTFQGFVSEGGAKVSLYIWSRNEAGLLLPFGGGQTTTDSAGAWSFTSDTALPDGSYTVYAQAFDHLGHTTSAVITVVANLVIDTVGPKVTNLVFDNRGGRVLVTFQDSRGVNGTGVGLNFATIVDANNYRFAFIKSPVKGFKPGAPWLATGISAAPGTAVGPQTATILINGGRGMRGGRYLFTVKSVDPANLTGVQDLAGNALDGEFYSFFPSGNNHVGGNFVAELDAVHHRVYAPKTTVGTASPVTPPGARGIDRFIGRNGRQSPKAAASRRAFAVAHPLQTQILKTAKLSSLR
ncbi:Ig-like domain-containing protein [Paludisphaera borealis]|uniref:PKD domain-containing protein n=1 Tax=Paludisphaera borealis TaxID=1387353 RepID=A0A1U7CT45_9BACT|nr:Ig-like domain-containing protein [Paludisphaera borealis]APW62102.1 hypothetical protein BSF38_03634 [Paludisphaera borealis]